MDQHPPTPAASAASALAVNLQDSATRSAERGIRSALMRRLPKVLHPLVRGGSRSVGDQYRDMGKRWVSRMVFSAIFSIVFFGVVAAVLAGVAATVLYAVATAMM